MRVSYGRTVADGSRQRRIPPLTSATRLAIRRFRRPLHDSRLGVGHDDARLRPECSAICRRAPKPGDFPRNGPGRRRRGTPGTASCPVRVDPIGMRPSCAGHPHWLALAPARHSGRARRCHDSPPVRMLAMTGSHPGRRGGGEARHAPGDEHRPSGVLTTLHANLAGRCADPAESMVLMAD
jgi:hypothetical protein